MLNWMVGAVMVAVGSISVGYGGGMMWRSWLGASSPHIDHIATVRALNFDAEGKPVDGTMEITRGGQITVFDIVNGRPKVSAPVHN